MNENLQALPEPCQAALRAIEADALNLPADALAHIKACPACAEARVLWVAQEEAPQALAPAGYFQNLPARVLRKLPQRNLSRRQHHPILWSAAAIIALATGIGGFLAGRANRTPMVEASLPAPVAPETQAELPSVPYQNTDDVMSQLSTLTPQEAEALAKKLPVAEAKP
jgi:anti-sigma factor RsiW